MTPPRSPPVSSRMRGPIPSTPLATSSPMKPPEPPALPASPSRVLANAGTHPLYSPCYQLPHDPPPQPPAVPAPPHPLPSHTRKPIPPPSGPLPSPPAPLPSPSRGKARMGVNPSPHCQHPIAQNPPPLLPSPHEKSPPPALPSRCSRRSPIRVLAHAGTPPSPIPSLPPSRGKARMGVKPSPHCQHPIAQNPPPLLPSPP